MKDEDEDGDEEKRSRRGTGLAAGETEGTGRRWKEGEED